MSDDTKSTETVQDWDKGNTNVLKNGGVDHPASTVEHPGFEPDLSMVGVENPVGVPSEEQIEHMSNNYGRSSARVVDPAATGSSAISADDIAASYPSLRIHGFSASGSHIGAGLNYYTIYTSIDITPTGLGQRVIPKGNPPGVYTDIISNSQLMLDKLVETISLRAQPVVMSQISSVASGDFVPPTNSTFLPAGGRVWSMSFAIEHNGAWDTLQTGWVNSKNPVGQPRFKIAGGPTVYDQNPDLGSTVQSNLSFMAPPFINDGDVAHAATNTFIIVSSGPF